MSNQIVLLLTELLSTADVKELPRIHQKIGMITNELEIDAVDITDMRLTVEAYIENQNDDTRADLKSLIQKIKKI